MKDVIVLLLFIVLLISCKKGNDVPISENNNNPISKNENYPELKCKLIGKWMEVSIFDLMYESCTFAENDSIYQKFMNDTVVYSSYYQVIGNDSILVTRNWEIEENKRTTKHEVTFLSDDTIFIKLFTPIYVGITGFQDLKLTKMK